MMEAEDVYPLFPLRQKGKPFEALKFVNEAGKYEPGVLAAKEKAKLPPDAIAIVQQLVLWFPKDIRLMWLLGELYAVEGNLVDAKRVMDYCLEGGQFSNRKLLVEHREAVTTAVEAKQKAAAEAQAAAAAADAAAAATAEKEFPISWQSLTAYLAIVAALVAIAGYRAFRRGFGCGPSRCR
jgi:hypothetical protein